MKIIQLKSLAEVALVKCVQQRFCLALCAVWNGTTHKQLQTALVACPRDLEVLFVIESFGSDDIEEFAINECNVTSLPSVVCYQRNNHQEEMVVDGDIHRAAGRWVPISALDRMESTSYNFPLKGKFFEKEQLQHFFQAFCAVDATEPIALFMAGDRSSVGKSSICMALLATLVKCGMSPQSLAYIKPVTQCEAEQPITQYCNRTGIENVSIGPVVFYKGFTRSFLAGETDSPAELLNKANQAVQLISLGKKLVLVDGVGYPSVGSICSISNADVAHNLDIPVLIVGKPGVGDAVDSFNLNATFFSAHGVDVLGAIFNKFPATGFYSLEECTPPIASYFEQYRPNYTLYGLLPLLSLGSSSSSSAVSTGLNSDNESIQALVDTFVERVNLPSLLFDVWIHKLLRRSIVEVESTKGCFQLNSQHQQLQIQVRDQLLQQQLQLQQQLLQQQLQQLAPQQQLLQHFPFAAKAVPPIASYVSPHTMQVPAVPMVYNRNTALVASNAVAENLPEAKKRTREEIEAEARKKGAAGG